MTIELFFGKQPFVVPSLSAEQLAAADADALRLLLLLCADRAHLSASEKELRDRLGMSEARLEKALSSLTALGILQCDGKDKAQNTAEQKPTPAAPQKRTRVSELPSYTDAEFAAVLEKHKELEDLITEAQNALGKIFNIGETKLFVGIAEEFGFDEEFLLILLDFCKKTDRKSMRYIEKLATSLYDGGIRTAAALTEHFHRLEAQKNAQARIRKIFGMGERALTSKEKDFIAKWTGDYGFGFDMIEKAYEITVNATSKPSMSYTNKVLESWYSQGIKTVEDTDRSAKKTDAGTGGMSFDVDDFFKAALDRSYNQPKK